MLFRSDQELQRYRELARESGTDEYAADIDRLQMKMAGLIREQGKVNQSMGQLTSRGFNTTFAIQQLAYAVDDAAISFSTGGFAGAVRGAANNLSTVAMGFSATAGAAVGVGLAIGSVALPRLIEWMTKTEDTTESLKAAKEIGRAHV